MIYPKNLFLLQMYWYYYKKISGIHRGRGTLEEIRSAGNFFPSMHTQNWIKTKSSVSLLLKSVRKNGKEMGETVRLNSLFGVHISRGIA